MSYEQVPDRVLKTPSDARVPRYCAYCRHFRKTMDEYVIVEREGMSGTMIRYAESCSQRCTHCQRIISSQMPPESQPAGVYRRLPQGREA